MCLRFILLQVLSPRARKKKMKTYKKIMDVACRYRKNDFSCINDFDSGSHSWKCIFKKKSLHRSWSFTEEAGGSSFRSDYLTGSRLLHAERESLSSLNLVTERLPEKNKKTNCNFSDCIICNFYNDTVLLRNG